MRHVAYVCLLLCLWAPQALADAETEKILKGVQGRYGELSGFRVPYEREVVTRSMALLGAGSTGDLASGNLFFKPPQSLRLEQERPESEILLTDGESLWWYIPGKKTAYRYDAKEFGRELRILTQIFEGLLHAREAFQITLLPPEQEGTARLELRPTPPWTEVDHFIVTVATQGHGITRVEIVNTLGGITRFKLGKETRIEVFDENLFTFSPPEGVRVLEETKAPSGA